jgi:hypothetical protein
MLGRWREEQAGALTQLRLMGRLRRQAWWWYVLHPLAVVQAIEGGIRVMLRLGWCIEQMVSLLVVADLDMWEPEAQEGLRAEEE